MVGVKVVKSSDVLINPFAGNTILLRDGKYYSVNHYPAMRSASTGEWLVERVEFRYELTKVQDWDNMKVNPADHGVEFDDLGYVVGYR